MSKIAWLTRRLQAAGEAVIVLTVFLVFANVIGRALDMPIKGAMEILVLGTGIGISLMMAHCAAENRHIVVKMLTSKFPPRARLIVEGLGLLVPLPVFAWYAWANATRALLDWQLKFTEVLLLPFSPFRFVFVLGCAVSFIVFLVMATTSLYRGIWKWK